MFNAGMLYLLTVGLPVLQSPQTSAFRGIPLENFKAFEQYMTESHRQIEEQAERMRSQLLELDRIIKLIHTYQLDIGKIRQLQSCFDEFPFLKTD